MKKIQIAALVVFALLAIAVCLLESGTLSWLQSGLLGVISPISRSGSAVKSSIGTLGKDLMTLDQLQAEY